MTIPNPFEAIFSRVFEAIFSRLEAIDSKLDRLNAAQVPETTKRIFGIDEAAKHTGFSKHTLYRLTSEKGIPHSKRGRKVFFDRHELDVWLLQHKQK